MKHKILNGHLEKEIAIRSILATLLINLVIVIVFVFTTDLMYETNDDYYFSILCGNEEYFNYSFINYYFARLIFSMQSIVGMVNVFVLFQIVVSFISFVVIMFVFLSKDHLKTLKYLGLPIAVLFACDHYYVIQFTKTSAIAITAGTLLLLEYLIARKKVGYPLLGCILTIVGSAMRFENILVVIAFIIIFLIALIITNKIDMSFFRNKMTIMRLFLIIVIIASSFLLQEISESKGTETAELRNFFNYNVQRSQFVDYIQLEYKSNKSFFSSLGISENSYSLMSNWVLDYDSTASYKNLKLINERMKDEARPIGMSVKEFMKTIKYDLGTLNFRGCHLAILLLVSVIGVLLLKPKWSIFPLMIGVLSVLIYIYLFWVGRPIYRATYVIDFISLLLLLYSIEPFFFKDGKSIEKVSKFLVFAIVAVCVCLSAFLSIQTKNNNAESELSKNQSEIMFDYVQRNNDKYFVFSIYSGRTYNENLYYYNNPLTPLPKGLNQNTGGFGGWDTMSPYMNDKLKRYSLKNVFKDSIDNDKLIIVENNFDFIKQYEKHLNEHYATKSKIKYVPYDEVGGYRLWKVKTL